MSKRAPEPSATGEIRIHATTVSRNGAAAILRGPSGSGKSDLALRFLSCLPAFPETAPGAHALVADDQTIVRRDAGSLIVTCPATIAGRIEVRGLGIVDCPAAPSARLALIVDLVDPSQVERLPEYACEALLAIDVARIVLAPFEASAPIKLALALDRACAGWQKPYSPQPQIAP